MKTLYSIHYKIQFSIRSFSSPSSAASSSLIPIRIENRLTGQPLGSIDVDLSLNEYARLVLPVQQRLFNLQEILLALIQFFFEEIPSTSLSVKAASETETIDKDLNFLGFRCSHPHSYILESPQALFDSLASNKDRCVDVAVGVLRDKQDRILMGLCAPPKPLAGLWEFPGGKVEPGESPLLAVARELHEELKIDIHKDSSQFLGDFLYIYPHIRTRLFFYLISRWKGVPQSTEHQDLVWVDLAQIIEYPVPPSTLHLLRILQKLGR